MLFIVLWLISPIVLLILFLVQLGNNSELKRVNKELRNHIQMLMDSQNGNQAAVPDSANKTDTQSAAAPPADTAASPFAEIPRAVAENPEPDFNIPRKLPQSSQPAPAPVIVREEEAAPKKNRVSTINIILILGALFISLSGFIFAAAAWGVLNTFFKAVVLLSFSAIFFGIHSVTERKLNLPQTGRIFYILGSVFLPAAVIAAGLLEVFGSYYSLHGDGWRLILSATALSICIPFFKGAHDYKNRFFAAISHYSFSAALVLLVFHLVPRADVAVLVSAVYSLLIVLAEPFAKGIYENLFGEDNVFSAEYGRFAIASTLIIGTISVCVFTGDTFNAVTLIAFAIFSVCFLTRSITEKHGTFSALAFAFFITVSLFSGFDPGDASGFASVIAATALIYGVLSSMGLFPDVLGKALTILAICTAGISGLIGVAENISIFAGEDVPSVEIVIAAGAVFVQMLILSFRNKNTVYRAFSFGAMIWFVTDLALLTELELWRIVIPFAAAAVYFAVTALTPLRGKLYSRANDIIFSVYAIICSIICCFEDPSFSCIVAIAVVVSAVILTAVSDSGKCSSIISPILTFNITFPLALTIDMNSFTLPTTVCSIDTAISLVAIMFCIIAAVLLFIPRAENYAKSYGVSVIIAVPLLVLSGMACNCYDFVPMLAITAYAALYCAKSAFPKEKFSHVNFIAAAFVTTAFFVGLHIDENSDYLLCFPGAAVILVFAVYAIGEAFDTFEKVNPHICRFVWWTAPVFASLLMIAGDDYSSNGLIFFGIILMVCSAAISLFRKNTLNMFIPLWIFTAVLVNNTPAEVMIALAAVMIIAGRLLFSKKVINGTYADVFSLCAFVPAAAYLFESGDDIKEWFSLILLSLCTLNILRKEQSSAAKRRVITASMLYIFPLVWAQPFFEVPDLISVQFNLLPVLIFCIALKFIWKDAAETVDNFSFVMAIISLVILFFTSLSSGEPFDAVFIGIVLFIMLAISFIIKKKRWFVLAVASMVASGVLLSFGQRDSIAWLVYLALAGAALIALGLANELKKQQQKSGEETKLSRFMSDWTW